MSLMLEIKMSPSLCATVTLLILSVAIGTVWSERTYHIVPSKTTTNGSNVCLQYPLGRCFLLDEFSSRLSVYGIHEDTLISFLPGNHFLSSRIKLQNVNAISLLSELVLRPSPAIYCNSTNSAEYGFDFEVIRWVTIKGLQFYNCGPRYINGGGTIYILNVNYVVIANCLFFGSYVYGQQFGGGAAYISNAFTVTVTNNNFTQNSATCDTCFGGALFVGNVGVECTLSHNYFYRNYAGGSGGGVAYFNPGYARLTVFSSTFIDNQVISEGGAIYLLESEVSVSYSYFSDNSVGKSGGSIYSSAGNVTITDSYFSENLSGIQGGAINLEATNDRSSLLLANITHCYFTENEAGQQGGAIYSNIPLISEFCNYTRNHAYNGGAISADSSLTSRFSYYFENSAQSEGGAIYSLGIANLDNDTFRNNHAHDAAALFQYSNTVAISNCTFLFNVGISQGVIQARHSKVTFSGKVLVQQNQESLYVEYTDVIFADQVTFTDNVCQYGSAITSTGGQLIVERRSAVVISGNNAVVGGGLFLRRSSLHVYETLQISNNIASINGGGLYLYQSSIDCIAGQLGDKTYMEITNNTALYDGGGLYLIGTEISIFPSCFLQIGSNIARQIGGGLYLKQSSKISLFKNTHNLTDVPKLEIFSNLAMIQGGGVFVSDLSNVEELCEKKAILDDIDLSDCFIQTIDDFPDREVLSYVNTFFWNNSATDPGNDIYGGLLDRCRVNPKAEIYKLVNQSQTFTGVDYILSTCHFDWPNNTNKSELIEYISSDPVEICFCFNDRVSCSPFYSTVYAKKGQEFTVQVAGVDQMGNPVRTTVITAFSSQREIGRLKEGQEYQHIDNHCSDLTFNVYSTENKSYLILYPDGPCQSRGLSERILAIDFLPCSCPVGFENTSSTPVECICRCDKRLSSYVTQCFVEEGTVEIDMYTFDIWISSTESHGLGFIESTCPFNYCVDKPVNISLNSSQERDRQCAFNRSGILCGECQQGLSLVFASSRCRECTNYFLFLLIPFSVLGIALVALILVLNMTVAEGTINGLIFYANILAANQPVFVPMESYNALTIFISWLNLDWGIETCFYNGMNSYGKFLLQLAFPVYIFVIIGVVIGLSERSRRFTAIISKRKPIAALCTLILLSYSKLLRMIITSLQYSTLRYPDGSTDTVWLFDGNVPYFSSSHIPRFVIAALVILLGVVYTSLLLFGQALDRFSEYLNQRNSRLGKLMKWTSHSKYVAFVREYTAPLSDKHRYWVGLLLLMRIIHHLTSAFVPDTAAILAVSMLAFALVLFKFFNYYAVVFKNWPLIYNKWWVDALETTFLINLGILASATLFNKTSATNQLLLAHISMATAFLTFIAITIFHVCTLPGIKKYSKRIKTSIGSRCFRRRPYQLVPQDEGLQEEESSDEEMLADHELELLPPYTDSNHGNTEPRVTYNPGPIIRRAVPDDQLRENWMDELAPVRPEDYQPQARPQREKAKPSTSSEVDIKSFH